VADPLTVAVSKLSPRPGDVLIVKVPHVWLEKGQREGLQKALSTLMDQHGAAALLLHGDQTVELYRDGEYVPADEPIHATVGG
jgi:hypothetical protein